jgi:NitT/TauT family transport system ATP-binding protein
MRQRVAFLRTLMAGRPVLLLDEPFASLDAITRAEMQSWLAGVLGPDRHTVLLVTHDVEEALYLSDRVIVLSSRPARVADRIEIPSPRAADRAAAVTSPLFAELKGRALRSLAEGAR